MPRSSSTSSSHSIDDNGMGTIILAFPRVVVEVVVVCSSTVQSPVEKGEASLRKVMECRGTHLRLMPLMILGDVH